MKIFFLGSLINDKTLDDIAVKSKVKPSNAPVNFENMLVKGLEEAGADVTVVSLPTVSVYPGGNLFAWGKRKEKLNFGKEVTWIPCINLMFLKQMCAAIGTRRALKKWLKENKDVKDKVILNYSVYPPYSAPTQKLGKKYGTKTCGLISDLPAYLYKMHETKGLKTLMTDHYSNKMVKLQTGFDSYILLTEHMAKKMKIEEKPAVLVEGFSDASIFDITDDVPKNDKKTVMYAGALSKSFNIDKLLDGFMQVEGDYNLWLFGYGDLIDYIKECEAKDSRIHYFGKVDRKDLLEHQKAAHLLISVKSPDEDHANYAFPSKILEYMTSGTTVASTTVGGIPKAYFDYIYPIENDSAEAIRNCIETVLTQDAQVLAEKGEASKRYALDEKNYKVQGKRIVDFLGGILK
ncbi:MAG: glycosyltransferase [Clostridia bacterium]|nr:glycosyltransferase [Clostridia bacterium]